MRHRILSNELLEFRHSVARFAAQHLSVHGEGEVQGAAGFKPNQIKSP